MTSPSALLLAAAALVAAVGPATAAEPVVTWDWSSADAHGSGCHAGDVSFIAAGDELTVIFSALAVTLDDGGGAAANQECNLVVPVRLAQPAHGGWHIAALAESLFYGYVRTPGATGSIDFSSKLFGLSAGNLSAAIPGDGQDPEQEPYLSLDALTAITQHGSPCNQGHQHGNYMVRVHLAARRAGKDDRIVIAVDGQDIRLSLTPTVQADDCAR